MTTIYGGSFQGPTQSVAFNGADSIYAQAPQSAPGRPVTAAPADGLTFQGTAIGGVGGKSGGTYVASADSRIAEQLRALASSAQVSPGWFTRGGFTSGAPKSFTFTGDDGKTYTLEVQSQQGNGTRGGQGSLLVRVYEGDVRTQTQQQFERGVPVRSTLVFEGTVSQGGGGLAKASGTVAQNRLAGVGSLDDLLAAAFNQRPPSWRTAQESLASAG